MVNSLDRPLARRRSGFWGRVGILVIGVLSPAHTETLVGAEHLGAYEMAFSFSLVLDFCGDARIGEIYRQGIATKLDHCPFTEEAKSAYRFRTTVQRQKFERLLHDNGGRNSIPLNPFFGARDSCSEVTKRPGYIEDRAMIDRYGQGKIDPDSFPFRSCQPVVGL